jgi:hypothetical protein
MNNFATNGTQSELVDYETPFADVSVTREEPSQSEPTGNYYSNFLPQFESPFLQTYEASDVGSATSPHAGEFVQFLGELDDSEFSNNLYELAAELEDTWSSKISNEIAMGERFVPFATQQAAEYFRPLITASEGMIDRVSQQFSGNNLADHSESEIERFFTDMEFNHPGFSPAQEQLFGSLWKKVKSVVKKGIDFAKKGVTVLGKFLPMNIILNKLKGLIRPLLEKVLKFAIGKLPKNLQEHAQALANKYLNLDTPVKAGSEGDNVPTPPSPTPTPTTGDLDAVQTELDNHIAGLIFSPDESEADNFVMEYESSSDTVERNNNYETGGLNLPSLNVARQQFINELKDLQAGETPAPAIERFLPVAIMALRPLLKPALALIGRQKVVNFLAGLLAKLIGKYVPENVANPLATSIIDTGMNSIGFETFEMNKPDVAYETFANTIQETIQNLAELNEGTLNDNEALTMNLLEAFEIAAADNFPSQYIREDLRPSMNNEVWALKPRNGRRHMYKKYSKVFNVVIHPQTAKTIITFRGIPLANFLRDKLGLDPAKPIHAKVHLFEAVNDTKLTDISHNENLPGLGPTHPHSSKQLHPLTTQASALLLHEPVLGKDFPRKYTTSRINISVGQRFYYLEINGARLRMSNGTVNVPTNAVGTKPQSNRPAQSGDIRGIINFVKSTVHFNYYFSEEEAKSVVEKLNQNDFIAAATIVRYAVRDVLSGILLQNITNKVKIIHEAFPEMYLENYFDYDQPGMAPDAGKNLLTGLVNQLLERFSGLAYHQIRDYLKGNAAEFKQEQAQPEDGVTIKMSWTNIPGMATIKTIITAIRGNLPVGNLAQLKLPSTAIPKPEIKIKAGKHLN